MTREDNAVYIKNSAMSTHEREIRKLRHLKYADWQPEHEALGIEPIERTEVKEDFIMYSKRKPKPLSKPVSQPVPKPKTVVLPEVEKYSYPHPLPTVPISGNNDHLWQQVAPIVEEEEKQMFVAEDVPEPPEDEYKDNVGMTFDDVEDGDYCIIISGKLICASPSLEEIEDMLNKVVFNDNPVPIDDIVVVRKLKVKLGASLDER